MPRFPLSRPKRTNEGIRMFEDDTRENWHTVFAMGINTWCLPEYRPSFPLPPVCKWNLRITQPQVPVLCAAALPLLAAVPSPRSCESRCPRFLFKGIFPVPLWRATNLHSSFVPHCQPHVFSSPLRFLPPRGFTTARIQAADWAHSQTRLYTPGSRQEQQQRTTRSAAAPPGIQSRPISTGAVHGVIPPPAPPPASQRSVGIVVRAD